MQRVFRFDESSMNAVVAHHGTGSILTTRAATRKEGRAFNFLDFTVVPPGASIGVHQHGPDEEEIYFIIEGRGRMQLGSDTVDVSAGDVIINPPLGVHGFKKHWRRAT
jgi:mannose-6-phosphate isomerase-like protein (cupin superfamily)